MCVVYLWCVQVSHRMIDSLLVALSCRVIRNVTYPKPTAVQTNTAWLMELCGMACQYNIVLVTMFPVLPLSQQSSVTCTHVLWCHMKHV